MSQHHQNTLSNSVLSYRSFDPNLELPYSHAHRNYEIVHLPSGLRCLLISDSSTHMVAASATVGCGSFNDPDEIHGLAHLCEHLVVSGGPQTRLQQIVSSSGGHMNAYTGSDQTSFAFEVSSHAKDSKSDSVFILDILLPLFASYFTKLRFSNVSIYSETRAVHEEQLLNKLNPDKILWHGLRLLSSRRHPFSRFATGNSSTLSVAPKILKSKLALYHSQNFSPENIALVIKGPQTINHLKKVAFHSFTNLEEPKVLEAPGNRHSHTGNCDIHESVFDTSCSNFVFIKHEGSHRIRLCFPMSNENGTVSLAVQQMLYSIVGSECIDSLCYHLRKTSQLAENVFVHSQNISQSESVFFIDIEATNQGMKRIFVVLSMVFDFLENYLPNIPDSELDSIIREYEVVEKIQFKKKKIPNSSLEEIVSYSENLQKAKEINDQIVKGAESGENKLNARILKDTVKDYLSRDNLLLQIVDSSFAGILQFYGIENIPFKDEFFEFEYMKTKTSFSELPSSCLKYKLTPPLGPFATEVESLLLEKSSTVVVKHRSFKNTQKHPNLWHAEESLKIWTHQIDFSDEIEMSVHTKFAETAANAHFLVGIEIIAAIVGEKLQHKLYNLESLGVTWGVFVNVNGEPSILSRIGGPKELVKYGLSMILSEIESTFEAVEKCTYQELKRARVVLRKTYEDYVNAAGVKLVFVTASMLFDEGIISPAERIRALEIIEKDDVAKLGRHLLESNRVTSVLASGALDYEELETLRSNFYREKDDISEGSNQSKYHPESSFLVPHGQTFALNVRGPLNDPVAVVFFYIQIDRRSNLLSFAFAKLMEQVIAGYVIEELRMKRNLAYGVFCGMRMFKKSFGIHITVATGKYGCDFITSQIEDVLVSLGELVARMTDMQFEKLKRELAESTDEPAGDDAVTSNLFFDLQPVNGSSDPENEESQQVHWNNMEQILNQTYNFGGKVCEERIDLESLEEMSLCDFQEFFRTKVDANSPQRAAVVICKSAEEMSKSARVKILAKALVEKLSENHLKISEASLVEELEDCQDLETLTDLDLDKYFRGFGPAMRYQKFKMILRLGSLLKKKGAEKSNQPFKRETGKTFEKLEDLQSHCKLTG